MRITIKNSYSFFQEKCWHNQTLKSTKKSCQSPATFLLVNVSSLQVHLFNSGVCRVKQPTFQLLLMALRISWSRTSENRKGRGEERKQEGRTRMKEWGARLWKNYRIQLWIWNLMTQAFVIRKMAESPVHREQSWGLILRAASCEYVASACDLFLPYEIANHLSSPFFFPATWFQSWQSPCQRIRLAEVKQAKDQMGGARSDVNCCQRLRFCDVISVRSLFFNVAPKFYFVRCKRFHLLPCWWSIAEIHLMFLYFVFLPCSLFSASLRSFHFSYPNL